MFNYPQLRVAAHSIHSRNVAYGFKAEGEPRTPELVTMLINTEIAEAFEEIRSGRRTDEVYFVCPGQLSGGKHELRQDEVQFDSAQRALCPIHEFYCKPEGFSVELADALIRILDAAPEFEFDITWTVAVKMAYNNTRPPKHGRTC